MRAVFGLVLIVGVALAGGAVMMAQKYISAHKTALAQANKARQDVVPTTDVMVAGRSLRYGERLNKEDVLIVKWPVNALPEGVFTEVPVLFPDNTEDNRFVLRAMEKGEAIMAVKVTEPGEDAGLTSQLERGMRAFAIRVDVSSGVSGFLRPGDRVDVIWTGNVGEVEGSRGEVSRLIRSGVQIIAIDQIAGGDLTGANIARTITVSVPPADVLALELAQQTGRLSLSLVGAEDDTVASAMEVDQRSLLGLGEIEAAPRPVEEKVCTIRTRRGAEVMEIPIPCTN